MNLDQITDDRLAVIKELANRKPQIKPEKEFPTALYYANLSMILFAVTYAIPGAMKVWGWAAKIGILVGVILAIREIIKWGKTITKKIQENDKDRMYH